MAERLEQNESRPVFMFSTVRKSTPKSDALASRPTEIELSEVSKEVSSQYRKLLTHLGTPLSKLESLLQNELGNVEETCFKGLVHWLGRNGEEPYFPATWTILLEAIEKGAERKNYAERLRKKLLANHSSLRQYTYKDPLHRSAGARDDEMTAPGPPGFTRSPSTGDQTPHLKRAKSSILVADKMSGSSRSPSTVDQNPPPKGLKSNIDSTALLRYKSHFVAQLHSLGVVLGVKEAAAILDTPATLETKYIQITERWMRCTAIPTWEIFCSCLSEHEDFTYVQSLIEQEQLERHEKDSTTLLHYINHFVSQLLSLGVVLGVKEKAAAILATPASLASKYIQITDTWMRYTANPTLEKFCSCLSKCKDFTHVRTLIEQEQLGRREEDKTELVHSTPEDIIALGLGPTGVGKSTFGNFVTGLDNSFEEGYSYEPQTKEVSLANHWMGDIGRWFRYMDSPGLNHDATGNPDFLAEAIAVSSAKLAMDLREVCLSFSVILIVTPLNVKDPSGILLMMKAMQNYDNFWDHSILLLTHANCEQIYPGLTQEEKEKKFGDMLKLNNCPKVMKALTDKVKGRLVFVESKDWRSDSHAQYKNDTLKKIVAHSDAITKTYGHYKDKLHSIGREAYTISEMQYIKDYPEADPESQGAKDEIYRKAFLEVKSVALKAIRIKLADGEDVEKLKNIASMKDDELQRLGREKQVMIDGLIEQLHQAKMEIQRLQEIISAFQLAEDQKNVAEKHSQLASELEAERQRFQQVQTEQARLQQHIQGLEHALKKKKRRPWYKF